MKKGYSKFEIAVIRGFGLGVSTTAPSMNGFNIEVQIACILFRVRGDGGDLFHFSNYWTRQTRPVKN